MQTYPDFTIVFGGDGTLLKTARMTDAKSLPVLSVNTGTLGYLTEIKPHQLASALKKINAGQYVIDERTMLDVRIYRKRRLIQRVQALNEAVVRNLHVRLTGLTVKINEKVFDRIKGDGVIVATPTGSTGYNWSAGGTVLRHTDKKFVITPVCPFHQKQKAKLISDTAEVSIIVDTVKKMSFSADGQVTIPLEYGDVIKVKKSPHVLKLIRLIPRRLSGGGHPRRKTLLL